MDSKKELSIDDYIISVCDLENFIKISKALDSREVFNLLDDIQILIVNSLLDLEPVLIKNIGDGNLIIFKKENVDVKISALYNLKKEIEALLKSRGFNTKASFSNHYGEVTIGKLGIKPFESIDAFGESINTTFVMNGKPFRGRFNISPQLFRKLDRETRKIFHKYTPQIMYIAD
ncbi:MAG: hypothetical protein GY760_27035 [Deltaproteobacteria bacterium]|nr:hypothetical protein [Deltaproteobacteria bacterium]